MSRPPPAAAVRTRAAPSTRNKLALAWRGSYRSRKEKAGSPPQVPFSSGSGVDCKGRTRALQLLPPQNKTRTFLRNKSTQF
ncbi:hypothetical protein KOW79_006924 [Hemibagrus wyckioides]|uniref:Uncharacterized protein n=1 Tax=Hemibagrus wyckioides TaxID=337641 RepID=A0A9D3NY93_9TELE|nr:hypothetical protein KOW79_006924 [Hemibagrus wyckioides]